MTELVERYVHQVGRYLPPKERAEIEAELRSQLHDQLEGRYGESPSKEEAASLLSELGHPYLIAASYSSDQYLIGPLVYPYMMMVLRYGWVIIPSAVAFLNIFEGLIAPQPGDLVSLLVETVLAVIQATLMFSAIVVLFFAIMQRTFFKEKGEKDDEMFNPLDLPEVDDPGAVDRFEAVFGITFGIVFTLALLYFVQVGGLTLRFNLSDPGDVIPVPMPWLIVLILAGIGQIILQVVALRRERWNVGLYLTQTLLEVLGMVCLYFVVFEPLLARIVETVPSLADNPSIQNVPEFLVIITALITLFSRGSKLVGLWGNRNPSSPFTVQARR